MPRGVLFPGLVKMIEWVDKPTCSEAEVYSPRSGDVVLVAQRGRWGWAWRAQGWLGVELQRDKQVYGSRYLAKRAAVTWWGCMTVADRAGLEDELEEEVEDEMQGEMEGVEEG